MPRYCDICRQAYAHDEEQCPHCAAASNGVYRNGSHREANGAATRPMESTAVPSPGHGSDPEIDLGKPATQAQAEAAGPPSGASFTSWTSLLPGNSDPKTAAHHGVGRQNAMPDSSLPPADAEIDLGSPVATPNPNDGPPSGASFTSWTALLESQTPKPGETPPINRLPMNDLPVLTARGLMGVSPVTAEPPPPTLLERYGWLLAVGIGLAVGLAICFVAWSVGQEPTK